MIICWRIKKQDFLDELCRYHISGLLKVAPEHIAPQVLARMGKPGKDVYLKFMRLYAQKIKKSACRNIWCRTLFPAIRAAR